MKNYIILILFFFSLNLFAFDQLRILESGTLEQKTEAMLHLGYARNKKVFWYCVKYLDYSLKDEDPPQIIRLREAAAEALGRLKDERAVKYLVNRWKVEKNIRVKRKIMYALSFYRNEAMDELINEGLQSDNTDLQFETLLTCAHYNKKELADSIASVYKESENDVIKAAASFTLIQLGSDQQTHTDNLKESLTSKDPELRYWAAHFLGASRRLDALSDLSKALEIENRSWVRQEMQQSIIILHVYRAELKKAAEYNKYEKILN